VTSVGKKMQVKVKWRMNTFFVLTEAPDETWLGLSRVATGMRDDQL
jgi:hypothetical protein